MCLKKLKYFIKTKLHSYKSLLKSLDTSNLASKPEKTYLS